MPKTKKGFFGALLVFYGGVKLLFDALQDATYAADNAGTIVGFLASPAGNAAVLVLGFFLLIWAQYTRTPDNQSAPQPTTTPDLTTARENELLKRKLRTVEKDFDELRAKLANPDARARDAERKLKTDALQVAHELNVFLNGRGYADEQGTVDRFKQRHKHKVDTIRDRLDQNEMLTADERENLTFREGDGRHKIKNMESTLVFIGMGQ